MAALYKSPLNVSNGVSTVRPRLRDDEELLVMTQSYVTRQCKWTTGTYLAPRHVCEGLYSAIAHICAGQSGVTTTAFVTTCTVTGRDSTVGIATRYGLDVPGIESWWRRDFPQPSRPALGSAQPPIQWVPGSFLGVKWPGRGVDHQPTSSTEVKERI